MELVAVQWLDSRGTRAHWGLIKDIIDDGICLMFSVGWVLKETDEYIQLAPHIGTDPKQACGDMIIPKFAVVKRREIKLRGWQP